MRKFLNLLAVLAAFSITFSFISCSNGVDDSNNDNSSSYTITIDSAIRNGSVTSDKSSANAGDTVTLTATPDSGYKFKNFTVKNGNATINITLSGTTGTFTMPEGNVTVSATFEAENIKTVSFSTITNGKVSNYQDFLICGFSFKKVPESTVNIYVKPDSGYDIGSISIKDTSNNDIQYTQTDGESYSTVTFTMPDSDVTVSVSFIIQAGNKTITVDYGTGSYGSASASKSSAKLGTEITVTVKPKTGYKMKSIAIVDSESNSISSTVVTEGEAYKFTMPDYDVTVTVEFEKKQYAITYTTVQHGAVTGVATATYGDSVSFNISPEDGYELDDVSVTTESGDKINILENKTGFTMPASAVTVTPSFKVANKTYSISVEDSTNGSISVSKTTSISAGTTIELSISPDEGYGYKYNSRNPRPAITYNYNDEVYDLWDNYYSFNGGGYDIIEKGIKYKFPRPAEKHDAAGFLGDFSQRGRAFFTGDAVTHGLFRGPSTRSRRCRPGRRRLRPPAGHLPPGCCRHSPFPFAAF